MKNKLAIALAALSFTAVSAQAQNTSRWTAWVGCWSSVTAGLSQVEINSLPLVCISPTANANAVIVGTIAQGKLVSRDTIDASGATQAISQNDCVGSRSARWSQDDRRVYLKSSFRCGGNETKVSTIIAMNDRGEWLDVRGVSSGDGENVRVARYQAVALPASIQDQIPGDLRANMTAALNARLSVGAPIGTSAIAEASRMADSAVVEAWILERNQKFAVDAGMLVQMADAGIPSLVTDAVVAVSNPNAFAIQQISENAVQKTDGDKRVIVVMADPYCASSAYSMYSPYGYGVSAYDYDRYNCGSYGYRSGYNYGYGYGYGYGGGYGRTPVIVGGGTVIVVPGGQPVNTGQAVKGRGYTQSGGNSANSTARTNDTRPPSSSTSTSSGSTSSGSSTTTQSQPAQTETRTAKPRP